MCTVRSERGADERSGEWLENSVTLPSVAHCSSLCALVCLAELKVALEHFHVLLSEAELVQLYAAFPRPEGGFDFAGFSRKCYPQQQPRNQAVEGRTDLSSAANTQQLQQTLQQMQPQTPQQQFSPNSSSSFSQSASASASSFSGSVGSASQQPAAVGAYTQSLPPPSPQQQQFQQQFSPPRSQASPQQQFQSQSFNGSRPGSQPVFYDVRPAPSAATPAAASPYGSTLSAAGSGSTGGVARSRSRSRSPSKFHARLTYNRPLQGRFAAVGFGDGVGATLPHATPYPAQELRAAAGPRFDHKPLNPPIVEVQRRHNISRQYNRDGTNSNANMGAAQKK